jgi:hypothetical protein
MMAGSVDFLDIQGVNAILFILEVDISPTK